MPRNQTILLALAAAIVVIGLVAVVHYPANSARTSSQTGIPVAATPIATASPAIQPKPPEPTMVVESAAAPMAAANMTMPAQPTSKTSGTAKAKPPIQDPVARLALNFVGTDPMAEQYWTAAINNPDLPTEERKDLIEDLNEDGLSDPKHPGPEDLPLIVNRLLLIEALAPDAMDQVNADAFAEAYKDLSNLLAGQPAQ